MMNVKVRGRRAKAEGDPRSEQLGRRAHGLCNTSRSACKLRAHGHLVLEGGGA